MDITINEVTFALPCKSFFIDYSVSKKRTLPVVKEFVIRYIFTLDSVTSQTLAKFFGFNSHELLNVLEDLKEESLVVWHDDEIRLSRYALDRFEEAGGDGIPRFFEVTDEFATATFDLMSYRLITKRAETTNSPNAIEVKLASGAYKNPLSKANRAFNDQFSVYLEEVLQLDPLDDWMELYKINSVASKDDKMLPLRIRMFVDTENLAQLYAEYADDWVKDWDTSGSILGEIQKNLSDGLLVADSPANEIVTHAESMDDPVLRKYIQNDAIDTRSLLQFIVDSEGYLDQNTRLIVGSLYLEENIKQFHDLLDKLVGTDNKIQSRGAIWCMEPNRKLWGRSSDFEYFVKSLKSRLDERFKPGAVALCLPVSSHQEARAYRDQYWRSGVEFQGVNSCFIGAQTELFFLVDAILVSIFHINDGRFGNQTIPVGYITTDPKRIDAAVSKFSNWIGDDGNRNKMFEKHRDSEENVFNNVTSKIVELR